MSGRDVASSVPGWLFDDEAEMLYKYAQAGALLGPLLEVGNYCGRSTCFIGDAAVEAGTVVFAVDHHRGSPEMDPGRECHNPDMSDPVTGRHDTLVHFRRTLERAGLEGHVLPVVGSSAQVAPYWRLPVGFAFVDGAHDGPGVMFDALAWSPHVLPGGFLAFHDTPIPEIGSAVDAVIRLGFELVDEASSLKVLRR